MPFSSVTFDQLVMFVAVVEHGTFSAAGRAIGRVQSAVSHAVAALEGELGVTLFDRSRREPRLTDAGRKLVGEAQLVLSQLRAFRQQATELRGGVEPEIELVVDILFPRARIARALRAFHEAFPTVGVRLHTALLDEAVALVRDEVVDFGICNVVRDVVDPLVARPCTEVVLVPVCAASHPLAHEPAPQSALALRRATQIVLAERLARGSADQGVLSTRTWRVADLETKLELLRAGVGWGNMPRHMVDEALAAGHLTQLFPEPWSREGHRIQLSHVGRSDRPLGPGGRWLSDALARSPHEA